MMYQRDAASQQEETAANEPIRGLNITEESFDTPAMQGTMQQLLADNLGRYVVVDFLVGVDAIARRVGVLYAVGRSFLVLYEEVTNSYQACDIFSVKFVSFFPDEYRYRWQYDPYLNISGILRPGGTYPQGSWNTAMQPGLPAPGGGGPWRNNGNAGIWEGSMTGGPAMPTRSPETIGGCSHCY